MEQTRLRVAGYPRVSTEEQRIHGLSITAQEDALKQWAREHGCDYIGSYNDAGISARSRYTKRPALLRLLEDVKAGKVDLIIFTKLDRWFRNIADYYEVQRVLDQCGVAWKAIWEDYETETASGRLKVNIMLAIAQDEADRTGERIRSVFESKVQRGEPISGKVPIGYRIQEKKMVIDPEAAPLARDIFRQYLALRSVRALRRYVMNTYGKVMSYGGLRNLLRNERYIGRAHGQDQFCPALIDPETFAHVQEILDIRAERYQRTRTDRVYLFTGLVYCAECGNKLSSSAVHHKYIYYRCTRNEKLNGCPHKKKTSELVLEDWLLHNIVAQFSAYNAALAAQAAEEKPPVDTTMIRRKLEKLKDLYLNDLIDRESYQRDYTALRQELNEATAAPPPKQPVDLAALSNALDLYSGLTKAGKKEFWSHIIGKIVITNNDDFSVTPFSP